LWAAIALLIILAGSIGAYRLFVMKTEPAVPFQAVTSPRKLTTHGKVGVAALSPDANYVAYTVADAGRESILMRQTATAVDRTILAPAEIRYEDLAFSQDGNYLYYATRGKDTEIRTLYRVSVLGGDSRKLIDDIDEGSVTQSPDGKRLAFVRSDPGQQETALMIANADGSGQEKLLTRKSSEFIVGNPAWSPDGRVIVVSALNPSARGQAILGLAAVAMDGGFKEIPSQVWGGIDQIAWLGDGSGFLMSAADQSTGWFYQIWFVSYPGGKARKVTNDPNNYMGTSLSRDSSVLLTVQSDWLSNIWVAPDGDSNRAKPITTGKYDGSAGVAWAKGGKIVYGTRDWDIWIMEEDGSNRRLLTPDEHSNRGPAVSPDGRYIFFDTWRKGISGIWRMGIDGSGAKRITRHELDRWPSCSPDGKWVLYRAYSPPRNAIWKVGADGGTPVQWTAKLSGMPAIAPDGRRVAGYYRDASTSRVIVNVVPFDGDEREKSFDLPFGNYGRIRWTPDGQALSYSVRQGRTSNIWIQPLAGGAVRQLTNFTTDQIWDFDWAPDNRLILARGPINQDLVLISNRENR